MSSKKVRTTSTGFFTSLPNSGLEREKVYITSEGVVCADVKRHTHTR